MKKLILISTPIVIIGLFLIWYFGDDIKKIPIAPSAKSFQWKTEISRSDLQIRKLRNAENVLLLRPTVRDGPSSIDSTDGALQFDPTDKTFKQVVQQTWVEAEGQIKTCEQFQMPPGYKTYGSYPLNKSINTNGQKVAVLSAAGPRSPAIFSFPFGQATGRIFGTRYVEIFNSENPAMKSEPIRVGNEEDLNLCWSPDDNFIVVYSSYFTSISVINITELQ